MLARRSARRDGAPLRLQLGNSPYHRLTVLLRVALSAALLCLVAAAPGCRLDPEPPAPPPVKGPRSPQEAAEDTVRASIDAQAEGDARRFCGLKTRAELRRTGGLRACLREDLGEVADPRPVIVQGETIVTGDSAVVIVDLNEDTVEVKLKREGGDFKIDSVAPQ